MFDASDGYVNLFVGSIILVVFVVYYYCSIVRPPILTCSSEKFKSFLKESMPILSEKYWPTVWCYGSRSQTILQYLCCVTFDLPYEREILELADGGRVALDWLHVTDESADTPTILILPGIMGNSKETYVKKYVIGAHECNLRCVVYNYRGQGGLELTTPKLNSLNDATDLAQVVQHIKDRYPNVTLGACGTSMGAHVLAHYLIKYSHLQTISFAMMNNTLFDIFGAAEKMESGLDVYINKFLTMNLRRIVARFMNVFDADNSPWDLQEVMKSRIMKEFDDAFTSRMFGYNSVYDYYKEATLLDKMDKIKIPVLCLNAADDPSQPLKYSEDDETPLFQNNNVAVMITARGGHMAHLEGLWPFRKKDSYLHRTFRQYFAAMFQNDSYKLFLPSIPHPKNLISTNTEKFGQNFN